MRFHGTAERPPMIFSLGDYEMKIIICLTVAALLFGCDQAPPHKVKGTPVSVGMVYQDAEPLLSGNGAMHVDLDNIKDSDTHINLAG